MKKNAIKTGLIFLFIAGCMVMEGCLPDGPEIPDPQKQLEKDLAAIDAYLAENNIVAQQHTSGLRYVIHRATAKSQPTIDSCVTTNYAGRLLTSTQNFDAGKGVTFPLKSVIYGWQIGLPLLHEGDSATLYIPSGLGYGYLGYPPTIPSNSNLIFNIGLVNVKKPDSAGRCN